MRRNAVILASVALIGGDIAAATAVHAQSRTLPKGSALAATPPIDRRGKQFHSLSPAYQRSYRQQGFHPSHHPY